jgi:hypothetical protein
MPFFTRSARFFLLFLLGSTGLWTGHSVAGDSAPANKKKLNPPAVRWSERENKYVKEVSERLKAMPDTDSRKLMLKYFVFLQQPTAEKADDFTHALLDARQTSHAPLSGVGIFNGDRALCSNVTGDCGYSVGSLSDKHFVPLLRQGDAGAIEIALTRFLVAIPDQAELLSYYAAFRVPKVVTKHTKEVLGVLYKMRQTLGELNTGPACFHFRFFDRKVTPELIRQEMPAPQSEELIAACQPKAAPSASPSPGGKN